MKSKIIMTGLLALGLSALTANACLVPIYIACPNESSAAGIRVTIAGEGSALTDDLGNAVIQVSHFGTYTVCVDKSTLPPGANLSPACQKIQVLDLAPPTVNFVLSGNFCSTPPPQGPCWMTCGGTIDKAQGQPHYSYGGVVYPGCSPLAAGGGNLNVVDHFAPMHFQGQDIVVDNCSGAPTSSPKVNVRIIDFHGTGIIGGLLESDPTAPVSFVGRAIDNHDGGAGSDQLFLVVTDASNNIVLQIGIDPAHPATVTTGNIQIHTSSCP